MKKQYSTPTLKSHGNVEEITQFFGASSANDFLFFAGGTSPISTPGGPITGGGSVDGVITPPSSEVTPR